jgi:hypothetical protein
MTFSQWLDAQRGRATLVAEHFHVEKSAVTQWRTNGVPRKKMFAMRELTEGAVSLEEMVEHVATVNR